MILVLLGTQHNEFIRLIKEVEKCINTVYNEEKDKSEFVERFLEHLT